MVTLEKLKEERMKQAEKLKKLNEKVAERREKRIVKEDIRKIRSAKMRSRFGTDTETVRGFGSAVGRAFKGSGKTLGGLGKGAGKFMLGVGEEMHRRQGTQVSHRKKTAKRRIKVARKRMKARKGKTMTIHYS